MGKSLRSKPKLRAKSIKRAGEFAKFVDSRNERIAQRMKDNLEKQKAETMEEDTITETEKPAEEKKVNTSGWRNTSRQRSKQKKSKKKKDVTRF